MINHLKALFFKQVPPAEILTMTPYSTINCPRSFCKGGGVHIHFCCIYVPSGNRIVEQHRHSIKQIATQKQYQIMEAVQWHNDTPSFGVSSSTTPVNGIYRYRVCLRSIDSMSLPVQECEQLMYKLGDGVWVEPPTKLMYNSISNRMYHWDQWLALDSY